MEKKRKKFEHVIKTSFYPKKQKKKICIGKKLIEDPPKK